jgi:hypothetical protein
LAKRHPHDLTGILPPVNGHKYFLL